MMPVKRLQVYQPTFQVSQENENTNFKDTKLKINSFVKNAPVKVEIIEDSFSIDYKRIALTLWILGIFFFGIRFLKNYFKLRRLLLESIIFKQSRKLKIVISENISVPFSVRMFKSYWVVIPVDLLNSRTDLSLAIKHELQHHRQGDTLWAVVIEVLLCVLFFNPAIYLWKNTIIEFQEFSCDEALTGQEDVLSHDYGNCLLRVAETALINRQVYAGTTSMAVVFKNSKYFKTFLLRRIEMIVKEKKSTSKWIPVCTGFMLAVLTVSLAYGVEKVARARQKAVNKGTLVQFIQVKQPYCH